MADENVARQKTDRLRELGFDAVSVADLGLAGRGLPDHAVLALAATQERIVLTHNGKDFKRLHRKQGSHSGILILPDDARHILIADGVAAFLQAVPDWRGHIERLPRPAP